MKAFFPNRTLVSIVQDIRDALQGRKLGDLLNLEEKGDEIQVTISKLGTSTLTFSSTHRDGGVEIQLTGEKIALAHKAFRDEVKDKLAKVVEQVGGNVLSR